MKKQKLLNITIVSIIVCVTILLLFSYKLQVMEENDNSIVSEETSNINIMYIMGNDTKLFEEYNQALLEKIGENKTEQEFLNSLKKVEKSRQETMKKEFVASQSMAQSCDSKSEVLDDIDPIETKTPTETKIPIVDKKNTKDESIKYTQEELLLVAKVIQGEAGSDFMTDVHQQLVGCVIINRVNHEWYPDTIKEVVYQKGQYQCVKNKNFHAKPSQRAIDNAKLVLDGKVNCPSNIIYQSEFKQGDGVYKTIETIISTTYFCY